MLQNCVSSRIFCVSVLIVILPFSVFAHPGISSTPTTSCDSIDSDEFTVHTNNQIDNRLVGTDPLNDWKLFITRGTTAGTTYLRNTNVWTNTGNDIDWTGLSPYNSTGGNYTPGTLISPRHIIMADHYAMSSGAIVTFVDNNNISYNRIVTAVQTITGTDIRIGVLERDVPDSITFYPIIDTTTLQATLRKFNPQILDIPIVVFDQEKKAIVHSLTSLSSSVINHNPYTSGSRSPFSEDVVSGDSGNPAFILIDDHPVILLAHDRALYGPNYGAYIAEINDAMTLL